MNTFFKFYLLSCCALVLISCNDVQLDGKCPDWAKNLTIYEIMPKQYSEKKNIAGITEDLGRIQSMFFNAICLLPIQTRDESNNAFNPNCPFAINNFTEIDPQLGNSLQLNALIDSAHRKNIKVLIEWNFTGSGPNHKWRLNNPKYYLSNETMVNNHYNQDYVKFNLTNASLQKELLSALKTFLKTNRFDGVVFYNLDKMPDEFIDKLMIIMRSIRPMLTINHSESFVNQCHYNMNNVMYGRFEQAYTGNLQVNALDQLLDTISKFQMVNYLQDYLKNEKYGPDAVVFYNAYKYYHTLTYFLPGIPWTLNGQEDPQFETINLFSEKPFSRNFKYNNDFYRSLNQLKQNNPSLWNFNPENLPVKISDSNEVLVMERKAGKYSCVGMFNITNRVSSYKIQKDLVKYYDVFNKTMVSFPKDVELKLGPYQSLLVTNIL